MRWWGRQGRCFVVKGRIHVSHFWHHSWIFLRSQPPKRTRCRTYPKSFVTCLLPQLWVPRFPLPQLSNPACLLDPSWVSESKFHLKLTGLLVTAHDDEHSECLQPGWKLSTTWRTCSISLGVPQHWMATCAPPAPGECMAGVVMVFLNGLCNRS